MDTIDTRSAPPELEHAPLRCATAGSVDDGKSTLLGRLLFDAKALMADQLEHVEEASRRRGYARTDLALLTDGLRAEREQGITIDVAWRYFATPRRRFVLADSPGHVEYTRNMVTAASQADVAIVLVDARAGLVEQTKRHLFVARLVGVRAIAVVVNKMDLVSYEHATFARIRDDVYEYLAKLPVPGSAPELAFFPISALLGDNVVEPSSHMPWYDGPTLLAYLECLPSQIEHEGAPARFPVQWVIRPQDEALHDYRGYAGRVCSGKLVKGQRVRVLPAGTESSIAAIEQNGRQLDEAKAGTSCVVHLSDDVSVSRGDLIVPLAEAAPELTEGFVADIAWLHPTGPRPREVFLLKHGTREVRASIEEVLGELDVASGVLASRATPPAMNTLARVKIKVFEPIAIDRYAELRDSGCFLLIDATSGATRAGGMAR